MPKMSPDYRVYCPSYGKTYEITASTIPKHTFGELQISYTMLLVNAKCFP